ncbi:TonB-dependent receptor [Seonamhaeicola sp.]|uniref:TonB-dependent receptor n=1 Tax=Seonamhaeicola sp. TaxID=1912245 RepID=UPI00263479D4|nr:TonB-dependent receptor [Seonamhaeicola sp.]
MYKSILILFLISFGILNAQNFNISSRILDKDKPLKGANVFLVESNNGTITNANGNFVIENVPSGDYTLKVSYVGYLSKEVSVKINNENIKIEDIELQEDHFNLEQVVLTATRNEILRRDAPIVCNVLDDKLLTATQSVVLAEGLSFQPALRIENNCQNCGFNNLRMNGLEGAYSQILIDGRPIFNSLQGVYGLEQIPQNMIERVEVVRSGGSALYGSSAIAGTVNIITKQPIDNSAYLKTNQAFIDGTATDQTYMIGTDMVTDDLNAGLTLSGFNRNREFWDANGDSFSEIGKLNATSFAVKAFYKPTDLSKITFNGFNIYEFRRGGNKFERPLHEADIAESTTHNILNGGLTYEQYTKSRNHKFSTYLNYQNLDRDSYYGAGQDINAYGNSEDNSFVGGFQYTGKLGNFAGGSHTLVTGFEYNRNNLKDNAPSYNRFIDQTAEQFGVYVQDVWEVADKFDILLGARFDNHNLVEDPVISPRANILYKINPSLQFRLGYARGFRAPQVFDEDLHITQVGGEGTVITNASNLNPEYSNAFSSSLDFNKYMGDWSLGITIDGFYTELTDVFILEEQGIVGNGDLLLERRNGSGATVAGVTINPKIQYKDKVSFQFGFTFQNSKYDEPVQWSETVSNTNKSFFRTPNEYGFYVLSWNADQTLTLNLSGVYTGSMLAPHYEGFINTDVLETTPSFFENNFKIDFTPKLNSNIGITFNAGIQNFTNAYQDDFDLGIDRDAGYIYGPGRPRTYFLGMHIEL